ALGEAVLEAVRGQQLDPPLLEHSEHHPPGGRAQIDRRDRDGAARRALYRAAPRGRGGRWGRGAGGAGGGGAHLRNAAAAPASTGTCRPVVCERSPAVSAKTAFATFAGSTSRFSRVRWA